MIIRGSALDRQVKQLNAVFRSAKFPDIRYDWDVATSGYRYNIKRREDFNEMEKKLASMTQDEQEAVRSDYSAFESLGWGYLYDASKALSMVDRLLEFGVRPEHVAQLRTLTVAFIGALEAQYASRIKASVKRQAERGVIVRSYRRQSYGRLLREMLVADERGWLEYDHERGMGGYPPKDWHKYLARWVTLYGRSIRVNPRDIETSTLLPLYAQGWLAAHLIPEAEREVLEMWQSQRDVAVPSDVDDLDRVDWYLPWVRPDQAQMRQQAVKDAAGLFGDAKVHIMVAHASFMPRNLDTLRDAGFVVDEFPEFYSDHGVEFTCPWCQQTILDCAEATRAWVNNQAIAVQMYKDFDSEHPNTDAYAHLHCVGLAWPLGRVTSL